MKFILLLLMTALSALSSPAEQVRFYIGTQFDHASSPGIYLGSLDSATGQLGPLTFACAVANPGYLAMSPNQKFVYAVLATSSSNDLAAFAAQPDGTLRLLNRQATGGTGVCYVSVAPDGKFAFAANYSGSIACFRLMPDGSVGERTALVPFTGSGPNRQRQQAAHAHAVNLDAGNKFLYACDLGSDRIWIFKFDAATGTLAPNDPSFAAIAPGSGPRHLAFHPDGKFVYIVNELLMTVTAFLHDPATGALTPLQTISTLPAGASTQGGTAAAIVCHPSGKWIYVSNRGSDTLSVFAIAPDGKLSLIQNISAGVKMPRDFGIDPTGYWLLASGQKDNRLALLKIDPATGLLSATDQSAPVPAPTCVLF